MKITLDLTKNVSQNAQTYFEKAKRSKKKVVGLHETKTRMQKQLQKEEQIKIKQAPQKIIRQPKWYEKFHWCLLSNDMLAIGGRDATSNEIIVKKHTLPHDVVIHTDMAGSPFVVIHTDGKQVPPEILQEAAQLCAVYSRAWQRKFGSIEVFSAKPEQITKHAQSGEYISKGAFMVRGTVTYHTPTLHLAIGNYQDTIMAGPPSAIRKHCTNCTHILPGDTKTSHIAKLLSKTLNFTDIDTIIRNLPTGGCQIDKHPQHNQHPSTK